VTILFSKVDEKYPSAGMIFIIYTRAIWGAIKIISKGCTSLLDFSR
jgi:hypothetical protein